MFLGKIQRGNIPKHENKKKVNITIITRRNCNVKMVAKNDTKNYKTVYITRTKNGSFTNLSFT
jgi:broad specificity polyphosphatase/5'/3'-nucleotidase SurE